MTLRNIQDKTTSDMQQGVGRAYYDYYETPDAGGVTPTTEMGYMDSFTLNFTDTQIELKSGTPLLLEDVLVGEQLDSVTISFDEHNFLKYLAFVSGTCSVDGSDTLIDRGGNLDTTKGMLLLQQDFREGDRLEFRFWKVVGDGNNTFPFVKNAELDKWEGTFKTLYSARNWINESLDDGEHYCQIRRIPAAEL